jgi:hypothetical protein
VQDKDSDDEESSSDEEEEEEGDNGRKNGIHFFLNRYFCL